MGEILNRREQIKAAAIPPEIPDASDLVSKTDYATASKAGVVKVGTNINVASGKISVPAASDETAGVVKVGTGLSVDEDGFLNASGSSGFTMTKLAGEGSLLSGNIDLGVKISGHKALLVIFATLYSGRYSYSTVTLPIEIIKAKVTAETTDYYTIPNSNPNSFGSWYLDTTGDTDFLRADSANANVQIVAVYVLD